MTLKYVILDNRKPIIFFDIQNHSDFKVIGNITSAGFIQIYEDEQSCDTKCKVWGNSSSLNISSHPDDEYTINRLLTRY